MLVCLLALSAGFVSCSDDEEGFDTRLLIGRWELVSYEGYYYTPDGERIPYEEPVYGEYAEFFEDGTVYFDGDNGTWNASGNRLIVNGTEASGAFTVASLTSTELILEVSGRDEYGEYFDRTIFHRVE
ncbi:hypothetical protein M3090_03990 [Bacteroides sp. ET71]|uniref:lipocalin family protein n=1 Tax=Bacteroides sp. ET71 TaxID=2939421 RepID=UPI002012682A|nr:lipocalin family protein [Bacteroides sp. ET71]MCL1615555.1 hypothetical protein [Bacteroides sp. ET71]